MNRARTIQFHRLVLRGPERRSMGSLLRRRPIVVANPPDDRKFRTLIDSFAMSGSATPKELEAVLRTKFPNAVVRPRELSGEPFEVWYVYRDGRWIRSDTNAAR